MQVLKCDREVGNSILVDLETQLSHQPSISAFQSAFLFYRRPERLSIGLSAALWKTPKSFVVSMKDDQVTWASMPRKDQLLILCFVRIAEPILRISVYVRTWKFRPSHRFFKRFQFLLNCLTEWNIVLWSTL